MYIIDLITISTRHITHVHTQRARAPIHVHMTHCHIVRGQDVREGAREGVKVLRDGGVMVTVLGGGGRSGGEQGGGRSGGGPVDR